MLTPGQSNGSSYRYQDTDNIFAFLSADFSHLMTNRDVVKSVNICLKERADTLLVDFHIFAAQNTKVKAARFIATRNISSTEWAGK